MEHKSLKERVEGNAVIFFATAAITAFGSGFAARGTFIGATNQKIVSKAEFDNQQSQLAALKSRNTQLESSFKNQQNRPDPLVAHPQPPLPELVSLLNAPREGFQWNGYRAHVDELHSAVNRFLDYLQDHPGTKYSAVQSFYSSIDEAASTLILKAQDAFVAEKEADGTCEPKTQNYNQKVFIGPSWFLIQVEKLRKEHERAPLTLDLIGTFRRTFDEWRRTEGI